MMKDRMSTKVGIRVLCAGLVVAMLFQLLRVPTWAEEQNLSVTATVNASVNELEYNFSASQPSSTLKQGDEITFTISYRSTASGTSHLVIRTNWEKGTIDGTSQTVDAFEYVVGSASTGFGGAQPTVDLQNNRITWDIPALTSTPTAQTVTYKLRVRSDLPTDSAITAKVHAGGTFDNTTITPQTLTFAIKKSQTSGPTATPAPASTTATPTPTLTSTPLIQSVVLEEITDTSATVVVTTSSPATANISYGTNATSLTESAASATRTTRHRIRLEGLTPSTRYYFRVRVQTATGTTQTSDLFTFTTASKGAITIEPRDITLWWGPQPVGGFTSATAVATFNQPLTVMVAIDSQELTNIKAHFKDESVLGLSTMDLSPKAEEAELRENLPGVFSGALLTPARRGTYRLSFTARDRSGGVSTVNSQYLVVASPHLTVADDKGIGIEKAHLNVYQITKGRASKGTLVFTGFTDYDGRLPLILPAGTYTIEAHALGYKTARKTVELGISTSEYPILTLERQWSLQDTFTYFKETGADFGRFLTSGFAELAYSKRAKDMFALIEIGFIVLFTVLARRKNKKLKAGIWEPQLVGVARTAVPMGFLDSCVSIILLMNIAYIATLGIAQSWPLNLFALIVLRQWLLFWSRKLTLSRA